MGDLEGASEFCLCLYFEHPPAFFSRECSRNPFSREIPARFAGTLANSFISDGPGAFTGRLEKARSQGVGGGGGARAWTRGIDGGAAWPQGG